MARLSDEFECGEFTEMTTGAASILDDDFAADIHAIDPFEQDAILGDVLDGAEVGLAVFDEDLRLLTCNARYRKLCGYSSSDVSAGTELSELIRLTLQRTGQDTDAVEAVVSETLSHLQRYKSYTFQFSTADGQMIDVCRRRVDGGRLIETLKEVVSPDKVGVQTKNIEHVAETARARMMHAMEVMADGFALYDAEDRLIAYNTKYVDLNPHIADLILPGAKYEDMLRKGIDRGGFKLHGKSKEDFLKWRVAQHQSPGAPHEMQLEDGRWILVSEKRTDDGGIVGIRSDITELKKRELQVRLISRELKAKNSRFDTALNNMIQGLCMFDADQKLTVCNQRYLDMYGFSADVVKPGIAIREIMEYSVSLGNYTRKQAQRALSERPDPQRLRKRTTIKQRLKDGRVIAVMNEPMPDGGSIATYQDITKLERHEEQLVAYTKKLERSNRELQDFAYVASHDLQEPLRKIEAFGDRLSRKYGEIIPDDGKLYIDRMQNAAFRMRRLISDLLGYSRVTTKAKPFEKVDIGKVAEEVISDLQIRIEENQAKVIAEDLPTIDADPTQIRQLIQNLLSNALKFKKPDVDPIVKVEGKIIDFVDDDGRKIETCRLTIEDNGIGFENQYKEQIFTIFQRLHGRMEYEGTGIGLATVRKIVERHNGTIDADGRPDEGATFIIELPVQQQNEEAQ